MFSDIIFIERKPLFRRQMILSINVPKEESEFSIETFQYVTEYKVKENLIRHYHTNHMSKDLCIMNLK